MTINPKLNLSTSTGGAGTSTLGRVSGRGLVSTPTRIPNRPHPYPWPYPDSAYQGAVGGCGAKGLVSRPNNPFYSPFDGPYLGNWPWRVNKQGWLNLAPTCRN
jgi:hypothetical protein